MKSTGVGFHEAVEQLAAEAGVALSARDAESTAREVERLTLIEVIEKAANLYRTALAASPSARAYLTGRGIGPDMIAAFGIGFAPDDRSFLKRQLPSDQQAQAVSTGLLIAGDDIPVSYDRFRARIMFPIMDAKGRAVGFGGRDLSGEAQAKYLNSPQSAIFDKGSLLYNAHAARQPAHDGSPVVSVEGYADVLASLSAGFPATVATMGTSVTEAQVRGLWRLADVPIMCFDGDSAGRRAIRHVIDTALPHLTPGRSLAFAMLPDGVDPDKMVRTRGAAAYAAVINRAMPLVDALWESAIKGQSLATPDQRAALEAGLMDATGVIPDVQLRRKYQSEYRERIRALTVRAPLLRSNGKSSHSPSPGAIRLAHPIGGGMPLKDAMMISALVAAPGTAVEVIERIVADESLSPEAVTVIRKISDALAELPDADTVQLRALLAAAGQSETVAAASTACHDAGIFSLDDPKAAAAMLTRH